MSARRLAGLVWVVVLTLLATTLPAAAASAAPPVVVLGASQTGYNGLTGVDTAASFWDRPGTSAATGPDSHSLWLNGSILDVALQGVDAWTLGDLPAAGLVNPSAGSSARTVVGGTLSILALTRAADGTVTSLAASWDVELADGGQRAGFVRIASDVPWSGLVATTLPTGSTVVGQSTTLSAVTVRNAGPTPALVPVSLRSMGGQPVDYAVADSTTCSATVPLDPAATCTVDLVFTPRHTMLSAALLYLGDRGSPVVAPIRSNGVGTPGAPTVSAASTVLGAVLTWTLSADDGGALPQSLDVSRSTDGGRTWSVVTSVVKPFGADSVTVPWPAGSPTLLVRASLTTAAGFTSPDAVTPPVSWGGRSYLLRPWWNSRPPGIAAQDLATGSLAVLPGTTSAIAAPDGSAVLVSRPGTDGVDVARVTRASGTVAPPVLYRSVGVPVAVSADGATVVWQGSQVGDVCWASALATGPIRCRNIGFVGFGDAALLPDGRTLLVAQLNGVELVLVDLLGGPLVHTGINAARFTLSPDARLVAVGSFSPDTGAPTQLRSFDPRTLRFGAPHDLPTTSPDVVFRDARHLVLAPDLYGAHEVTVAADGTSSGYVLSTPGPRFADHTIATGPGPLLTASGPSDRPTYRVDLTNLPEGTTATCAADAGAPLPCGSSWTAPAGAAGRHTLVVTATAPDGTTSTAVRGWTASTGQFVSTPSRRVLDTRTGVGAPRGRLTGGRSLVLTVPGLPADATAVTLNLTAVGATAPTYLTVHPADAARPTVSNLNVTDALPLANLVTVRVAPGGRVAVYDAAGSVDVVADLQGWFTPSAGDRFTPTDPVRLVDSRTGTGGVRGPIGVDAGVSSSLWTLLPSELSGPERPVRSLALGVVATRATAPGYLSLSTDDTVARPTTSNVNFPAGRNVANLAVVDLPSSTLSRLQLFHGGPGTVDAVADLLGYYGPDGSRLTAVTPTRVLDSRTGLGAPLGRLAAGQSVTVTVPGLPLGTTAVAANLTAVAPSTPGYLVAYPAGLPRPGTSSVNFIAGRATAGATIVKVDGQGRLTLTNGSAGTLDVVLDLQGYYAP